MGNEEYGARVRAAQAFKQLKLDQFVTATEIKKRTLSRILAGERAPTLPEARRIAEATDVPVGFLLSGWAAYGLMEPRPASDLSPTGELGRRAEGSSPSAEDRTRADSPAGRDRLRGVGG